MVKTAPWARGPPPTNRAASGQVSLTNEGATQDLVLKAVDETLKLPFHKRLFDEGVGVTCDHVNSLYGHELLTPERAPRKNEILVALTEQVRKIKRDAMTWFMCRVVQMIVAHAIFWGLATVSSIKSLREYWAAHLLDDDVAAIIWHCCYGEFDFKPKWDERLEKEYMDMNNFVYGAGDPKTKGCFVKLINVQKREAIKGVTRGLPAELVLKRTLPKTAPKSLRQQRRPKGETLAEFAVVHGKPKYGVAAIIKKVKGRLFATQNVLTDMQLRSEQLEPHSFQLDALGSSKEQEPVDNDTSGLSPDQAQQLLRESLCVSPTPVTLQTKVSVHVFAVPWVSIFYTIN